MKTSRYAVALTLAVIFAFSVVAVAQKSVGRDGRIDPKGSTVKFAAAEAYSDGNGVFLKWRTGYETGNLGFDIYRYSDGEWSKANDYMVPGGIFAVDAKETYSREYSYFDPEGRINRIYVVRSKGLDGRFVSASTHIYPRFESDLSELAGANSSELQEYARSAEKTRTSLKPVLPPDYGSSAEFANLPPNLTKQHWVAAQPGVKIRVKSEGIYRVSRTELENAGFDVNTDHANWQLYLDGNEQGMIVEQNGDYIEFYGKGTDTAWTDKNVYFLVSGPVPGKRIANTIRRGFGGTIDRHTYKVSKFRRDRALYLANILNGGQKENFFGAGISTAGTNITFNVDSIDFNSRKTAVIVTMQGFSVNNHRITIKINGIDIDFVTGYNQALMVADLGIPTEYLNEGQNTLTVTSTAPGFDLSIFESIEVIYERKYEAVQNQLSFFAYNRKSAVLTNFTDPNVRVFDLTYPDSPALITNAPTEPVNKLGSQYSVRVPANRGAEMIAVGDSAVKSVDSIVPNSPSTLHDSANTGELVIISFKDFLSQAGDWATYRNNDGMTTYIADMEDVADEFNYGKPGAAGITRFLDYARQNWSEGPGYALLLGDASFDPKNILGGGFKDYVSTRLVDTAYEETGSDDALVDFDLDGVPNIGIGRIPASTGQQVTDALNKVIAFESGLASAPARGALCASDRPDGYDFQALCQRVLSVLPGTFPYSEVNKTLPDSQSVLMGEINSGKFVLNYSGHGSTTSWSSSPAFLDVNHVPNFTNSGDLTLFTMLTCLNGYFIDPNRESLGERLLKATNGGAVATWASAGSTTPDVQEVLATRFYTQLGSGPMTRIGDLIIDAKSVVVGGRDVRLSWTLLGDPTLKIK